MNYYKATRPDGRDFRTGTVDYAAAFESGDVIEHPATKMTRDDAATYFSVATVETDCTGFSWPARLFRVVPVGRTMTASDLPNKRACRRLRVAEELPAHRLFGPQGEEVVALIARAARLTPAEAEGLRAVRAAPTGPATRAAWDATPSAREAAWDAAAFLAWDAAAFLAARALLVKDIISPEHFDLLYGPWREAIEVGRTR